MEAIFTTSTKKRAREDDEELGEPCHDHKKSRVLPFRVSPTSKHTRLFSQRPRSIPIPQTITPESSDSDISPVSPPNSRRFVSLWNYSSEPKTTLGHETTADTDSDMTDSQSIHNNDYPWTDLSHCPTYLPEPRTRAPNNSSGGRIPTPIYNHFPTTDDVTMSNEIDTDLEAVATSLQAVRQDLDRDTMLSRRYRLPSPISEDDTMISPTSGAGGMLGRLNVRNAAEVRSEEVGWNSSVQTDHSHNDNVQARGWWRGKEKEKEKGRTGKTILSMGYRADCEKCRTRVPGHWSHFIRV